MASNTERLNPRVDADIEIIRSLVGDVNEEQLRYVDCFLSPYVGLFVPSVGPCFYSITPEHIHPAYMFTLSTDDYCRIKIDGKIINPDHGTICAVSPNVAHHEIAEGEFSRYVAVLIAEDFFDRQVVACGITVKTVFRGDLFDSTSEISAALKDFMLESENKLPGSAVVLEALGLRLTHLLIRRVFGIPCPGSSRGTCRMQIDRVVEYINANYDRRISVSDMASQISVSPSHFARLFKKETEQSPYEYLIGVRLNQSRKLLRAGEQSLVEVALACGFGSLSHFSACFGQKYGLSPSQYRDLLT